jgi:4,5-dihydroxyphthalate decarboxylase
LSQVLLTLAYGNAEIVRPLKEGLVRPDGIELNLVSSNDATSRHWRFLRNRDFDAAECSASSYIAAVDRGLPFRALPIFLHRRFRHGFVYINTTKGITKPTDLIGRRVGVKSYQVTAVVWLRGILEHEYGVPHKSMEWFSELDEDVDFTPPEGLRLTKIPDDASIEKMLAEGEIDALLHPDIIAPILAKDPRVGRLFPDPKREEQAYFAKTGIFPIMHVMGLKAEVVDQHPWLPINLFKAFDEAKAMTMKRMINPRLVPLVWYQEAWEEQEALIGPDPWEYGLGEANTKNLETLIQYSYEQGVISRKIPLDELFLPLSEGRKRDAYRV